jgi:hypothetical protein
VCGRTDFTVPALVPLTETAGVALVGSTLAGGVVAGVEAGVVTGAEDVTGTLDWLGVGVGEGVVPVQMCDSCMSPVPASAASPSPG